MQTEQRKQSKTATKRAKKRQPTQTPPEWIDLFAEHDDDLHRVRMLWRRGGGRYRPLVPVNLALEDLERLDFDEWEELEMDETHFEWSVPLDESPDTCERRHADMARDLWAVAVLWTRAKGPVCDFQLRGYGSDEEILFEDGKRCNLSGEQSRYDDSSERERAPIDEALRGLISDERAAWLQMDRVKDGLVSRLVDDREKLFGHLDHTTAAAPELIGHARDVLERAIDFQQRHFEDYMSRASGRRELEANAFAEYQKSVRTKQAFAFLKDAGAALAAAAPMIKQMVEGMTGRSAQTVPDFQNAQQAMAYLHLTMQPEQLEPCFSGTDQERRDKALKMIAWFDHNSRMKNEREMLTQAEKLLREVLARPKFQEAADPEQVIAAKFVLGRAAIFRILLDEEG